MIRHAAVPSGVEIAYAVTGNGPPLVLMHGGEADHTQFDGFVPHLSPRVACIAYDQRDSGATRNPDADFGIADLADDAAGLIRALGHERAHVFGSSLGSVIAQAVAVRHPEVVDRLVLSAAIRIGRSVADINPDAAAALGVLRRDPARNAAEIARYFYPDEHLAQHPHLAQRFAGGRRNPVQQARRAALIPKAPQSRHQRASRHRPSCWRTRWTGWCRRRTACPSPTRSAALARWFWTGSAMSARSRRRSASRRPSRHS